MTVQDVSLLLGQLLPEPQAGLLTGMIFGTKAALDVELKQALISTGTIHITALSGMNISILCSLVATTLYRFFSRRTTCLLTVFIIIGFTLFVGPSASIVRAALMGSLSLVSILFGKQRRALYLLLVTTVIMIVFHPAYMSDISFQLSILSTLGIILFAKHRLLQLPQSASNRSVAGEIPANLVEITSTTMPKRFQRLVSFMPTWIQDDLRTTLAAQLFTTPLIALQFQRVSLIAPVANVAIGFLIAPLTVLGLAICALGFLVRPIAIVLSWIAYILLSYLVFVVMVLSRVPYSSLSW